MPAKAEQRRIEQRLFFSLINIKLTFATGCDRKITLSTFEVFCVKKAVIILGHGSRSAGADDAVRKIAAELGQSGRYEITEYAFLQFMQPSLHEALEECVGRSAEKIIIIPFFLQPGTHVTKDIPAYIDQAKKQYPGIEIIVTDFVGSHPLMTTIVLDLIEKNK